MKIAFKISLFFIEKYKIIIINNFILLLSKSKIEIYLKFIIYSYNTTQNNNHNINNFKMEIIKNLKELKKKDFQKITKIHFYDTFNETIDENDLPPNLTHLTFGYHFNQSIDLSKLVLLTHLSFDNFFNQPIDDLPRSLTHLKLGWRFNQSLDNLPESLTHLVYPSDSNLPFNMPSSLTHLEFGFYFNQPLNNLPKSLTHLKLGSDFSHPFDNLPKSLIHLNLGYDFNKPIDDLMSLPNLKSIKPDWVWLKYEQKQDMRKGKVMTKLILLKQGISNSKKYKQLFLLFEIMCAEVKGDKNIYKLRGMAQSLEIKGVDNKTKEELCSEIGAEILIKLNLAERFE